MYKPPLSFAQPDLSGLGFLFKVFDVGSPPRLAAGQNGRLALWSESVGSESFRVAGGPVPALFGFSGLLQLLRPGLSLTPPPKTTHGVERQELTGQLSNDGDTQSRSIASCCLPFSRWFPMRVWRWLCLGPPPCRAARLSTSGSSLTFSAVWALWSPRLLSQLRNCLGWLARTCCSPANLCKVACGSLR